MEESVKNPKNLNKIQTNVEQCSEHLRLRKPIITVLRYVMDKLVLSLMVMEMKTQLIECCKITYDNEDGDDGDVGDGGDDGDGGDGGDDEDETSSMNRLADHLLLALHYRRCQRRTQVTKQSKELYF